MITVPLYLLIGQITLLLVACYVLASAYRRLGAPPAQHDHTDEAAALSGRPLPDLGPVVTADGSTVAPPRATGSGQPAVLLYLLPGCEGCLTALTTLHRLAPRDGTGPSIHLLTVGDDVGIDRYAEFGFPVWRATRDLTDLFDLTAYPVFLAVDRDGMINAAGSVHSREAIESYLRAALGRQTTEAGPQPIRITARP